MNEDKNTVKKEREIRRVKKTEIKTETRKNEKETERKTEKR